MMKFGWRWIVMVAVLALMQLVISEGRENNGKVGMTMGLPSNSSTFSKPKPTSSKTVSISSNIREWWMQWIRADPENYQQNWPKFEFSWWLVLGTLIGMFGSALGSVGGVGGGGFYLPMLNFVIGFDAKTSTALSKAMVMGAAISSVLFNLKEKHPTENKPVIDYEFTMLFQPVILLGISIGVILNVLLPEWLVTALLIILFSQLACTTFKRATVIAEVEQSTRKGKSAAICSATNSEEEPENGHYVQLPSDDDTAQAHAVSEQAAPVLQGKGVTWEWFPKGKMAVLTFTWLIFLSFQIFKVYVPECNFWYWVATFLQVPVALGMTLREALSSESSGRKKKKQQQPDYVHSIEEEALLRSTHNAAETDVKGHWVKKLTFSLLGLLAGMVGGLLGVGGGGIMGPGFLQLGLSPQVSSATASFIMVFSSSLSVAEFYLLGRLPADYAIYLTLVAMLAAAWGQAVIKKVIKSSGRSSIIVFVLVGCILCAATVLGIIGVQRSYERWESGANMGLQNICITTFSHL